MITPFEERSRPFVYYNERAIERTVDGDAGVFLRDGIKSLAKQGVLSSSRPFRSHRDSAKSVEETITLI
jgi:hypothetical protein